MTFLACSATSLRLAVLATDGEALNVKPPTPEGMGFL
jgi:hypothetical protein